MPIVYANIPQSIYCSWLTHLPSCLGFFYKLLFIWICILHIIITQIMHGMQIALYILILFAHLSHSLLVLNRLFLIVPALVISLLLSVPFHPSLSRLVSCNLVLSVVTTLNSSLLSHSFLTRLHSFLVLNSFPRFSVARRVQHSPPFPLVGEGGPISCYS